ncbi:MAG: hypothetical protein FWG11_03970 [Promicromonosporaceae bacterium]|nr:hypothetical protein [Promicromonosporaceae bacterium]
MLAGAAAATAPLARAADYPVGEWGTYDGAETFWGSMTVQGRYGLCIDPALQAPDVLNDATATKVCGTYTSGRPDKNSQIAYLLAKYLETSDAHTATSLSQFVRAEYHPSIPVFYQDRYNQMLAEADQHAGPKDAYLQVDTTGLKVWFGLVREGEAAGIAGGSLPQANAHYSAGYTATIKLTTPNVTFTDGTQEKTITTGTIVSSLALATRHDLIADEKVTATIEVTDVPASCFLVHQAGAEGQRAITPLTVNLSGSNTGAPAETKWQPQIATEIPTQILARNATTVADRVKADAVGGSQWPVQEWANPIQTTPKTYFPFVASGDVVKSTLPPAASKTLPAGATVVSTAPTLVTLTGPGQWATATTTLPDTGSGHYAMRWCLDAAHQGANAKYLPKGGPFCDDYFSMTERFTIPMTLAVASELPDQFRARGQAPDDTITVSLPDAKDSWIATRDGKPAVVKVTGTFYAGSASSFTIADKPPADAKVLGAASVNVTLPTSGRKPVTVPAPAGFTVPSSQYGTWVWQIKRADQAPDVAELFDNDLADKFGQQLETHVTQMELTVQSEVAETSVTEPKRDATVEVCDNVWVEHADAKDLWLNQWGTDRPVAVKVDGKLYHSAVPAAQTLAIDPKLPAVDEYNLTFTAAGKDHAQQVCHTVKYGEYGAYGFAFGIDLAKQPEAARDYLAKGAATPLWLPVETTMVKRMPVIHTAVTRWSATNDGKETIYFTDDLWQIDWPDAPADTDMTGAISHGQWTGYGDWAADGKTIKVELWRVEGEVTPESCTADSKTAKLIAVNEATPALNTWGASQKVSGARFKAEGGNATYTFVITYPGDARTEAYQSICGEKSETITLIHQAPEFITQLLVPAELKGATVEAAAQRDKAIEVEAGTELVDVLHAWFPDQDKHQLDMTGWAATWDSYFMSLTKDTALKVVDGDAGKVYEGAVCTPETLLASSGDPMPVERAGNYLSPAITTPGEPGMVFMVETVTDNQGHLVRRGTCGVVSESAIILPPPEQPKPKITTNAPQHANVGEKITDEAILTGPFPKGTQVEFWYQHTNYTDPGAARDQLKCDAPDPAKTDSAIKIGVTVLDHDIAEGVTEKLHSPEFTSDKEGCTWIKETAYTSDGRDKTVLAEGYFGAAKERTMWHSPIKVEAGGSLANTGASVTCPAIIGGLALLVGGTLIGVATWRRRRIN